MRSKEYGSYPVVSMTLRYKNEKINYTFPFGAHMKHFPTFEYPQAKLCVDVSSRVAALSLAISELNRDYGGNIKMYITDCAKLFYREVLDKAKHNDTQNNAEAEFNKLVTKLPINLAFDFYLDIEEDK